MPDTNDYEYEDNFETNSKNKFYFLGGVIIIAVIVLVALFTQSPQTTITEDINDIVTESESNQFEQIVADATIKAVDLDKNEIRAELENSEYSLVADGVVSGKEVAVKINEGTVIQKLIITKNTTDGTTERSGAIEINLRDLVVGEKVNVVFNGREIDEMIDNTQIISRIIETNDFDNTFATEQNNISSEVSYMKVRILEVDRSGGEVKYAPYSFNQIMDNEMFFTLNNEMKVNVLKDPSRLNIEHAKVVGSIADISPDTDVFIEVGEGVNLDQGYVDLKSLVVISK